MISTLCGLLNTSFQLATGKIELHKVSAKQQGPKTASDRTSKKIFSALQQGQAVILISLAIWLPNIIVVIITSKMNVSEM
jgi:hypothetical protein